MVYLTGSEVISDISVLRVAFFCSVIWFIYTPPFLYSPDGQFNSARGHQDISVSMFLFHFKRPGLRFCVLVLDRYFPAIKDDKTSLYCQHLSRNDSLLNLQQGCMSRREKHYYVKGKKEKSMFLFYLSRSKYQRLMCFTGT